jgi:hypothetical protein
MEMILEHLQKIRDIDNVTFTVLIMIAFIASMSVRKHLVVPGLIVVLMPLMLGVSMLANYILVANEVFIQTKVDQWLLGVVAAGTVGAILSIGLAAVLAKLMDGGKTQHA